MGRHPDIVHKNDVIKKLAHFMIDNPGLNQTEIGMALGLSHTSISNYLRDSRLLQAVKGNASKRVLQMIPLAVKGFEDSLKSKNEKIKYFSSKDLLQTERILGPERIDVTIEDNSNRTVEELQELIKDAQKIPSPTIDAELIT